MPYQCGAMAGLVPAAGRVPGFLRRRRAGSGCWRRPSCSGGPARAPSFPSGRAGQGLGVAPGRWLRAPGGSGAPLSGGEGGRTHRGDREGRAGAGPCPQPRIPPGPASDAFGASLSQAGREPGVPPTFPGIGSGAGGQRWAGLGTGINPHAQPQPGCSGHGGGRMLLVVRLLGCLLLPLLPPGKGSPEPQLLGPPRPGDGSQGWMEAPRGSGTESGWAESPQGPRPISPLHPNAFMLGISSPGPSWPPLGGCSGQALPCASLPMGLVFAQKLLCLVAKAKAQPGASCSPSLPSAQSPLLCSAWPGRRRRGPWCAGTTTARAPKPAGHWGCPWLCSPGTPCLLAAGRGDAEYGDLEDEGKTLMPSSQCSSGPGCHSIAMAARSAAGGGSVCTPRGWDPALARSCRSCQHCQHRLSFQVTTCTWTRTVSRAPLL